MAATNTGAPMNPTLARFLNEAPTLAVLIVTVLGLSESDAAVWKEAVASLAGLVVWFTARGSIDGPVTQAGQWAFRRHIRNRPNDWLKDMIEDGRIKDGRRSDEP